jgi:hypothetical protein
MKKLELLEVKLATLFWFFAEEVYSSIESNKLSLLQLISVSHHTEDAFNDFIG